MVLQQHICRTHVTTFAWHVRARARAWGRLLLCFVVLGMAGISCPRAGTSLLPPFYSLNLQTQGCDGLELCCQAVVVVAARAAFFFRAWRLVGRHGSCVFPISSVSW